MGFAHLVHVDGNTASWGVSHKLNSGSTVFWIESDHDYREFFYALLQPWRHYVPIAPDMSDLDAARVWAWNNREEAEAISRRASALLDLRMRPQDLWCYVVRLLKSVARAQTRGPALSEDVLRKYVPPAIMETMKEVDKSW